MSHSPDAPIPDLARIVLDERLDANLQQVADAAVRGGAKRCSPDEAFEFLRQQSQLENRKLREVARTLVESAGREPGVAPDATTD